MRCRWVHAVPWDRQGHLNMTNAAYRVSFARRYRLERPTGLRGRGGSPRGFDGDFDECGDPKWQWTKTLVHNTLVDAVMRFCKDCGMVDVQAESSVGEFLESSFANDRRGSLGPPLPFLASQY